MDNDGQQVTEEMLWVFLMQDMRGYIRQFGAEQFLHDFEDLFPNEHALLVDAIRRREIKEYKKKGVLLGEN